MKSIIYWAQCKLKPDLIYVGKTHQSSLNDRIEQHISNAKSGSKTPFHQALLDYGLKNWDWKILIECNIELEFETEKALIKKYHALPVELLNVINSSSDKIVKKKYFPDNIRSNIFSNKYITKNMSQLGELFLRSSGRIKPIINLKTQLRYQSTLEAARKENIYVGAVRKCCSTGKMLEDGTRFAYINLENQPVLTEGHSKEHYINQGKGKTPKKIKNVLNGKIFKNISDVMKEYNVSKSTADAAARGTHMLLKDKWVICFLDEDGNEILNKNHKRGIDMLKQRDEIKYIVWHVDDEKIQKPLYFKDLEDLCEKLDLRGKSHIKAVCEGQRTNVENWRIAYFDFENKKPILTEKHYSKPRNTQRRIICLNDKREFDNCARAADFYKLSPNLVIKCARGDSKSVIGINERLRFAYLDEDGNPKLTQKHKELISNKGKKRILRLSTGENFNSLAEYLRNTGLPYETAKKYLINPEIDLLGYEFIEID
ncbi:MAG: GIY-YIG nuclease family protein [Saprospiraceae bacterium]